MPTKYWIWLAAVSCAGAASLHPIAAEASGPGPLEGEWWFQKWQVQDRLWTINKGDGATVAVMDSGVNAQLPELKSVVLPGFDATGSGGDGRRDLHGQVFTQSGWGHGTGMAALIAAQGRGTGMLGLAPQSKVVPIRAPQEQHFPTAIRWAANHRLQVLNISMAVPTGLKPGDCPQKLQSAIDKALRNDVVVVAGAGNARHNNSPLMPASCPGVLTAGGLDRDLKPWTGTNAQPTVDIAAPAVKAATIDREGRTGLGTGTSTSSALTSAVVALVRSKYPELSARQVVQRIVATARDVGPKGRDDQTGYGAIDPYKALTAKVPADAPNPVYDRWDQWRRSAGATSTPSDARPTGASDTSALFTTRTLVTTVAALLIFTGTAAAGATFYFIRRRSSRA